MDLQDLSVGLQQASNKQWGINSHAQGTGTISFPIAFTTTCYTVVTDVAGDISHYENPYINNLTNSTFQHWHRYGTHNVTWVAIGAQPQWGYTQANSTITFPIAYKIECFGVTPPSFIRDSYPFYESGAAIGIRSITLTSAFSRGEGFWISAGC